MPINPFDKMFEYSSQERDIDDLLDAIPSSQEGQPHPDNKYPSDPNYQRWNKNNFHIKPYLPSHSISRHTLKLAFQKFTEDTPDIKEPKEMLRDQRKRARCYDFHRHGYCRWGIRCFYVHSTALDKWFDKVRAK